MNDDAVKSLLIDRVGAMLSHMAAEGVFTNFLSPPARKWFTLDKKKPLDGE